MLEYKDPIKNVISRLKYGVIGDEDDPINDIVDEIKIAVQDPTTGIYRIFHNAIRLWNMKDENCKAITLTKVRVGDGKNALDKSIEMAFEMICWANKNKEDELMVLWSKVDEIFDNQHNTQFDELNIIHSFRSQEPVFDNRFALNLSPATTRLSSRTKLRLPSVSATYTFLAMEKSSAA